MLHDLDVRDRRHRSLVETKLRNQQSRPNIGDRLSRGTDAKWASSQPVTTNAEWAETAPTAAAPAAAKQSVRIILYLLPSALTQAVAWLMYGNADN
jgi:hypothetical protein